MEHDFEDGLPAANPLMKPKTRPVHEVRIGAIKAALWRNDTEAGVRYNATFSRLYKDGAEWRSTGSFGREDLLLLAKVADQAHTWVCSQHPEEDRSANGGSGTHPDAA